MKLLPKIYNPTQIFPSKYCFRKFYNRQFRSIIKIGIIGFLGLFLCCWILTHTQLHLCLTPSLDGIRALLFYKTPPHDIKRGDIVAIQGHVYQHLGIKAYAKRVIGFPGESIVREHNTIKVGSRILSLMEKTQEGHLLTPISLTEIPDNYVFVAGDHPRSIDSRYEEFGLVPIEKIWGKGLFAW